MNTWGMRTATTILPLLLAAMCCGCRHGGGAQAESRGLVYLFPGVCTTPHAYDRVLRGYRDGGVTSAIRVDEWETPFFDLFGQLQDLERNRAHAAKIADEIMQYRGEHPDAPIDLVGYSAGGGIAVLVTEALPAEVGLRNVVLAQCAVSPMYDLSKALQRIDGKLVNLHAPNDWFILGLGTATFGTVDRAKTPSAGKDGFDLAAAAPDAKLRAKVVQQSWTSDTFWETGHAGFHHGLFGYLWNRKCVAPWLRDGTLPKREGRN